MGYLGLRGAAVGMEAEPSGKQIKDRERQKGVNGGATQATVEWSGEIIE